MSLADNILNSTLGAALGELIAPTRCAGCERQGTLLCSQCLESLHRNYVQSQSCPKCAGPYGALTCTECWGVDYSFTRALALSILDGPLARAIVLYKDANERRLADVFGFLLAECVHKRWNQWTDAICWIPATKEALKRRGFDHGELLAHKAAQHLRLPAISLLKQQTQLKTHDQRGLKRKERMDASIQFACTIENASVTKADGTCGVLQTQSGRTKENIINGQESYQSPPRKILLIDDVFTTGATAEAATQALLKAGTKEVRVATLGRAW